MTLIVSLRQCCAPFNKYCLTAWVLCWLTCYFGHNYFNQSHVTFSASNRLRIMDIYQIATAYWDHASESLNSVDPKETPPFDPRPEVPVPNVPEENPPYKREPETPPMQPEPELPSVEPVVPEVTPLPGPGEEPGIPVFN